MKNLRLTYYLRAFILLSKRALCKPFAIMCLCAMPIISIIFNLIPDKALSTNIKIGIFFEEPGIYDELIMSELSGMEEGLSFVLCDNADYLIDNVTNKTFDCGFIMPNNYSDIFIRSNTTDKISIYTSSSSSFSAIAKEKLYANLLKVCAPLVIMDYMEQSEYFDGLDYSDKAIEQYYERYLNDEYVFTIKTSGNNRNHTAYSSLNTFPVYELIGLLIFVCSLLGVLNYYRDEAHHAFDSISRNKRLVFCIINIAAGAIPSAIIGYISLIIYDSTLNPIRLLIHILLYSIICIIYGLIYKIITRKPSVYQAALPVIIVASLLFTPSLIDITDHIGRLKYVSMLFAPYFF